MDQQALLAELGGIRCRCGRSKRPRATFCLDCYWSLPALLRRALYRGIGEGYEEAYAAAVEHLGPVRK